MPMLCDSHGIVKQCHDLGEAWGELQSHLQEQT
jgi:hypothetical protein